MSLSVNPTPYRIIWRCVPSPQSNRNVSPSRTTAMELTPRSTVGREADVPRKRSESDTRGNIVLEEARVSARSGRRKRAEIHVGVMQKRSTNFDTGGVSGLSLAKARICLTREGCDPKRWPRRRSVLARARLGRFDRPPDGGGGGIESPSAPWHPWSAPFKGVRTESGPIWRLLVQRALTTDSVRLGNPAVRISAAAHDLRRTGVLVGSTEWSKLLADGSCWGICEARADYHPN